MKRKLKNVYIFLFIVVFGLLVLPQFNLKIGDTQITYPNIDFSFLNSSATLGNFHKGYGLYDSKVYSALISFETSDDSTNQSELKDLVNIVNSRIAYSNLHDVNVWGSKDTEGYKLNIQFPDYFQESDKIAQYLVGKGQVIFQNDPQISQIGVALKDTDIEGQIKSIYDEQYGSVLSFKFAESAYTNFYYALQNTNNYFLMQVDNAYFAVIQDPNYTRTQSIDLKTSAIAVPFADVKLSPNVAIYTNIVRSYFLTNPLTQSITLNPNPVILKRDFVADRLSYIAAFIIIAIILITLVFVIKKDKKTAFKFVLIVLSYLVFVTFLLKLTSATLSVSLIVGFLVGLLVMFFSVAKLLNIEEDPVQRSWLKEIVMYSFLLAVTVFILFKFVTYNDYITDALGAIFTSVSALLLLCFVNIKYILEMELNFRPFRK